MRKSEYRFGCALTLVGALLCGRASGCEPPPGFVNPPRPDIAPLEGLLSHTEQKEVATSLTGAMQAANRPLQEAIRPTKDLPGVSGTFRLSSTGFGSVGSRRLVCLTDGSLAVEEVLHTEASSDSQRFRYVVWNYTNPKFRDVDYAVGEFVRTQLAPDRTRVNWTYRFALKSGLSAEEKSRFRKVFLEQQFAVWMRKVFGTGQAEP